jgi:hypothetical protein
VALSCIIRASDPETCFIDVVRRAVSFAGRERQWKNMDGAAVYWRFLPAAAGCFPEDRFPDPLTGDPLRRNQRPHSFACDYAFDIAVDIQIENYDGQAVFLT